METRSGQFITFRVARQEFAMDAGRVRGLLPVHEVIPLEKTGSWISAIGALRGRDFPVVDLRRKLGIAKGSNGRQPCVVVVEVAGRFLGFVADRVSEVIKLRSRDIHNGTVRVAGKQRRVLNPDQILSEGELQDFWRLMPIVETSL